MDQILKLTLASARIFSAQIPQPKLGLGQFWIKTQDPFALFVYINLLGNLVIRFPPPPKKRGSHTYHRKWRNLPCHLLTSKVFIQRYTSCLRTLR